MIDRIAHVAIGSGNKLDEMLDFYRELLGLIEVARRGEMVYLSGGKRHGYDLSIGPWDAGLRHFSFQIGTETNLERLRKNLRNAGVALHDIDPAKDFLISKGIRFVLPSGHLMEAVVLAPGRDPDAVPLIPRAHFVGGGPVALEHVTIDCDDVAEVSEFCIGHLGFRVTDFSRQPGGPWFLAFLHCRELHHDIGVFRSSQGWKGPGLNHFAFVVPTVTELVRVADAARGIGHLLECSPGRHILGDNIFIYVRDPSGNRVEVATPLSRVDFDTPSREFNATAHQEWSNFDGWRKDAPPISRLTLPCFDARQA